MIQLSISIVAGILAAVTVVVQLVIPNAIAFFTIALTDHDATAVTWTAAMRLAYSSNLPTLMRTDATASRKVQRGVFVLSWLAPSLLICVAISAILAPLGLIDTIMQTDDPKVRLATYIPDGSLLGQSTPPRDPQTFLTRDCSYSWAQTCAGAQSDIEVVRNSSGIFGTLHYVDTHIPEHARKMYESGLQNFAPTVSGPFDIQARLYAWQNESFINDGERQPVSRYRKIQNIIQKDSIQLFEGIVADTRIGGIGFRNHTVPEDVVAGAVWEEDLLFVDSETVCVDTNLTLVYSSPNASGIGHVGDFGPNSPPVKLLDRGGFAMFKSKPKYPQVNWTDTQHDAQLWMRAYKAAWMSNVYVAALMNITNLATYSGPDSTGNRTRDAFDFVNSEIGQLHDMGDFSMSYEKLQMVDWTFLAPYISEDDPELNPWNVTKDLFSDIGTICSGSAGLDLANITNLAASCGLVVPPARFRTGEPLPLIYDAGLELATNIYSCASVPRVSIKKTSFSYTGSGDLANLSVTDISPKVYVNEESKPLWIVEDAGLELSNGNPIWGIASDEYINEVNTSTSRSERLYIPGYGNNGLRNTFGVTSATTQNFPAIDMLTMGHYQAYTGGLMGLSAADAMYSGELDQILYQRWQRLGADVSTVGTIVDLLWTDIVANGILGTRSWLDNPRNPDSTMTVLPRKHTIGYQWVYGIFPLLTLIACACVTLLALAATVLTRRGPQAFKEFMNATSVGRVYTFYEKPSDGNWHDSSRQWISRAGYMRIKPFSNDGPASNFDSDIPLMPKESHLEQQKGFYPSTTTIS